MAGRVAVYSDTASHCPATPTSKSFITPISTRKALDTAVPAWDFGNAFIVGVRIRLVMLTASAALTAAVALGAILSVRPATASTVTEDITFSGSATYPANYPSGPNDVAYGYQSGTTISGSFQITFDPT